MSVHASDSLRDGIRLAESAIALLRRSPISILALYYIGTLPFVTGLLVAWNFLTLRPDALEQRAAMALGLSLLFAWMKLWQNRYAQTLYYHAIEAAAPTCSPGGYLRLLGRQTLVQALGLIAIPLSVLAFVPYPWVHGAFHSFTILDDGGKASLRSYWREAMVHSKARPRQQIALLWLLSPILLLILAFFILLLGPALESVEPLLGESVYMVYFSVFAILLLPLSPFPLGVFINVTVGMFVLGSVARSLFGIRTPMSEIPGLFGSSFQIILALILCWLLLDPLMKTAYVIRHAEHAARKDGTDIRLALKHALRVSALLFVACAMLLASPAVAQTGSTVDTASIETAIEEELRLERYQWRTPMEKPGDREPNWLQQVVIGFLEGLRSTIDWIGEWVEAILDWLFPPRERGPSAGGMGFIELVRDSLRGILVLLAIVLSVLALYLYYRYRKSREERVLDGAEPAPLPDLESESTTADALPVTGWLDMAEQLLQQGDNRLAARAVYLAILAQLAEQHRIRLARHKTNRDYRLELERYAHVLPGIADAFRGLTQGYEAVWYGDRLADSQLVHYMLAEHRRLANLEA